MFICLLALLGLMATVPGIYLVRSGWGIALLLWPFGIRPLFTGRKSLTDIFGVDPQTCDYADFAKRSDELRRQVDCSPLVKLNRKHLENHHALAMRAFRFRCYRQIADSKALPLRRLSLVLQTAHREESIAAQSRTAVDTAASDSVARTTQEIQLATSLVSVAMNLL